MTPQFITKVLPIFSIIFLAATCFGQDEERGLQDLDRAIEIKLFAKTPRDMNRVVSLCETALERGLSEENAEFARLLLSATLFQHASALANPIIQSKGQIQGWQLLRAQALEMLRQAVKHRKKFVQAFYLIAQLEGLPNGNRDNALEAVSEAIRHAGDDKIQMSKSLLLRGNLSQDRTKRLADYNQAIVFDPTNREALRRRGLYYLALGEHDKAMADLQKSLDDDSNNLLTHHGLAEALTALEKYDEALQHSDKAVELQPRNPTNYLLRARIKVLAGKTKEATDDLNHVLRLDPRNIPALLARARVFQTEGNFEGAKKDVERVLVLQPNSPQAVLLHSMISAAAGDFLAAASDLERLLEQNPKNVPMRMQLAAFYVADKRVSRAIKTYTEIVQDDKTNVAALRGRGDALLSIAKQKEAIADYETVLKIEPNHDGALNNLAWVLATSPDEKVRNAQRSIELGTKACEVTDYKKPHILSTLAAGYAESGDFDTAIKWSSKAVELGEGGMKEALQKELDSYKNKKPWRELQQVKEKPEPAGSGSIEL